MTFICTSCRLALNLLQKRVTGGRQYLAAIQQRNLSYPSNGSIAIPPRNQATGTTNQYTDDQWRQQQQRSKRLRTTTTTRRGPGSSREYPRTTETPEKFGADVSRLLKLIQEHEGSIVPFYSRLENLLVRYRMARVPSMGLKLSQSTLLRTFLRRVIEDPESALRLPPPREILFKLKSLGLDSGYLWADVMFEELREGKDENVIELWKEYTKGVEHPASRFSHLGATELEAPTKPQRRSTTADGEILSEQPKKYVPYGFPEIAAMTAFIRHNYQKLHTTTIKELMSFLKIDDTKKNNIPDFNTLQNVLFSYSIPDSVIAFAHKELKRLRPYYDITGEQIGSRLDEVYFAASRKDIPRLNKLYKEFTDKGRLPILISTAFISGFMECEDPTSANIVWKDMVTLGDVPSVKQWGAMLDGAAKSGNVPFFESVWQKLHQSGVPADAVNWTIRAQLYFSINRPQIGWTCLRKMEMDNIPITTTTINAILWCLEDMGRSQQMTTEVLDWAASKDIKYDIYTYNILLRKQSKKMTSEQIFKTLSNMKAEGIEPDLVTYVSILSGIFRNPQLQTPLDVASAVIAEMTKSEMKPNLIFYNTLINALLARFNDVKAVDNILSMMPEKIWKASPYTASILIQHYGRLRDFEAVEKVWNDLKRHRGIPDYTVHNTIVQVFARAREKDRMLHWMDEQRKAQKSPSYEAYMDAIECLLDLGDNELATTFTHDLLSTGWDWNRSPRLGKVVRFLNIDPTSANYRSNSNNSVEQEDEREEAHIL